ncbi:MAG: YitT family protein, partial [Chryseotalea sp.]
MGSLQRLQALKELRNRRIEWARAIKDVVFIVFGVLSAGLGLKGFLLPNNFLDGGVVGISLLIEVLYGINLSLLIFLINIPFILIAYTQVSRN